MRMLAASTTAGFRFCCTAQRKYLDACCVYLWAATPVLTTVCTFGVVLAIHPGAGATASPGGESALTLSEKR